jgi:hypothetical protein
MIRQLLSACAVAVLVLASPAAAQQVDISTGSVAETIANLKPGEFAWAPELAPQGPMLFIVNLETQRALLFRNGVPIAASTVSTGRPGHETPTGVFTILQKQVEHYSSKYDNAPMPYMQRLTWQGVALHAGKLPGYPASHGCIRLPAGFAQRLYRETGVGMTVVITSEAATPRIAPAPSLLADNAVALPLVGAVEWTPAKSASGPVSILVSAADKRAVVLRNGVVIGTAPVTVEGTVTSTWAYTLRGIDAEGQHWMRVSLSGQDQAPSQVPRTEWARFQAADEFKRDVAAIIQPGTTVIVTSDSLTASRAFTNITVLEGAKP